MPLEGFLFYLSVILVGGVMIAALDWLYARMLDRSVAKPREDNRLPEREYELLGDDWRDRIWGRD